MSENLLESIYRNYRQGLFSLALSVTGCRASAEDAIQHAFSRLNGIQIEEKTDTVAFVFRSVRNSAIDTKRKDGRTQRVHETIYNGYIPPASSKFEDPDARVLTAERDQILRQAIDELADSSKQTVLMRTYSALTFEQIGAVLEIPAKTAATQYRRALVELEQKLKGQI